MTLYQAIIIGSAIVQLSASIWLIRISADMKKISLEIEKSCEITRKHCEQIVANCHEIAMLQLERWQPDDGG